MGRKSKRWSPHVWKPEEIRDALVRRGYCVVTDVVEHGYIIKATKKDSTACIYLVNGSIVLPNLGEK